jgi:hypothetical protein
MNPIPTDKPTGPFPGYEEIEVEFLDGKKKLIQVRQAKLRQIPVLLKLLNSEDFPARVEWYASQKTGWSDNLTDESFDRVLEVGNTLARPTLERWWDLQRTVEGPTLSGFLGKILGKQQQSSASQQATPLRS